MNNRRTFVTIFTEAENFHLVKDVGQIPYFMHKMQGYNASLVTYQNNPEYSYLQNEVHGLRLKFLKRAGSLFGIEFAILRYLFSFSRDIDVLNLYHFKRVNVCYLFIYKLLNPKGIAYVKLDLNLIYLKTFRAFFFSNYTVKNFLLKVLARLQMRLTDLFSVETLEAHAYLIELYPHLEKKLIHIPNGVDDLFLDSHIRLKSFGEKENIIITVGRVGDENKNTRLFLQALSSIDLKDWKVYLIGPVQEDFGEYIRNYFIQNPSLKDQVIFTGHITDRVALFEWYNRAKILCLTSKSEGFPIVFTEALYFGNYIITTPVSSAISITDDNRYGTITTHNASDFAEAINRTIENGFLTEKRYQEIRRFSTDHFTWSVIIDHLQNKLRSL